MWKMIYICLIWQLAVNLHKLVYNSFCSWPEGVWYLTVIMFVPIKMVDVNWLCHVVIKVSCDDCNEQVRCHWMSCWQNTTRLEHTMMMMMVVMVLVFSCIVQLACQMLRIPVTVILLFITCGLTAGCSHSGSEVLLWLCASVCVSLVKLYQNLPSSCTRVAYGHCDEHQNLWVC